HPPFHKTKQIPQISAHSFYTKENTKIHTQKGASMAVEKELIALRADEKISRKEMAELIGTTPETYRKKELGESDWWGAEMFLIASKFNKRIDDIFLDKKSTKSGFEKAS
ncbi:hypothetical protein ABT112_35235, partial [Streptomyces sp. NPDC002055]